MIKQTMGWISAICGVIGAICSGWKLMLLPVVRILNMIADLKLVSADVKASKSYKAKVQESDLYDCDLFEKMLIGRDDYFDFTISSIFTGTTP